MWTPQIKMWYTCWSAEGPFCLQNKQGAMYVTCLFSRAPETKKNVILPSCEEEDEEEEEDTVVSPHLIGQFGLILWGELPTDLIFLWQELQKKLKLFWNLK